jgi:hypothetical protein
MDPPDLLCAQKKCDWPVLTPMLTHPVMASSNLLVLLVLLVLFS